jgi:uncharacterized protein
VTEPELDQPPEHDEGERGSERTCVASRTRFSVERLIRFVADPDGNLIPDLRRRLPGRGVWVEATEQRVTHAVSTKAFARGLKRPVTVPADLPATVERLIRERCLAALALANKAGRVVLGFAKVESALDKPTIAALLHAVEAADDGCRKLDRKLPPATKPLRMFTSAELSLAMGRGNVVHAALIKGGASGKFLEEAERLTRYKLPPEQPLSNGKPI